MNKDLTLDFLVDVIDRAIQDLGAHYNNIKQVAEWGKTIDGKQYYFVLDFDNLDNNLVLYHSIDGKFHGNMHDNIIWKVFSQSNQEKIQNNYDEFLDQTINKIEKTLKKYTNEK